MSSEDVCNSILPQNEQGNILAAAGLAEGGHHVAAEIERCHGGYDVGVIAAERLAGR